MRLTLRVLPSMGTHFVDRSHRLMRGVVLRSMHTSHQIPMQQWKKPPYAGLAAQSVLVRFRSHHNAVHNHFCHRSGRHVASLRRHPPHRLGSSSTTIEKCERDRRFLSSVMLRSMGRRDEASDVDFSSFQKVIYQRKMRRSFKFRPYASLQSGQALFIIS